MLLSILGFEARGIFESDGVAQTVDKAIEKQPRADDVFEAAKWFLARTPEKGIKIASGDTDFYIIKSPDWSDFNVPSITLIYSFDDNDVTIHRLWYEHTE